MSFNYTFHFHIHNKQLLENMNGINSIHKSEYHLIVHFIFTSHSQSIRIFMSGPNNKIRMVQITTRKLSNINKNIKEIINTFSISIL